MTLRRSSLANANRYSHHAPISCPLKKEFYVGACGLSNNAAFIANQETDLLSFMLSGIQCSQKISSVLLPPKGQNSIAVPMTVKDICSVPFWLLLAGKAILVFSFLDLKNTVALDLRLMEEQSQRVCIPCVLVGLCTCDVHSKERLFLYCNSLISSALHSHT